MMIQPLDLTKLKILPLAARRSLTRVEEILIDPDSQPPPCSERIAPLVDAAAQAIRAAHGREATVMMIYGAHLLRNGAAPIVERTMAGRLAAQPACHRDR